MDPNAVPIAAGCTTLPPTSLLCTKACTTAADCAGLGSDITCAPGICDAGALCLAQPGMGP